MAKKEFYQNIYTLREFRDDAQTGDFMEVFGEEVGEHLFRRFLYEFNSDILMLFTAGLDLANQRKLIKHLEEKT